MFRSLVVLLMILVCNPSHAGECAEKSFLEFFTKYAVDEDFSQNHTIWPLKVSTELFGDKKTQRHSYIKNRSENWAVEMPIFDFLRANPDVEINVSAETKSKVVLTFGEHDADILFDLNFAKHKDCWQLVSIREFER